MSKVTIKVNRGSGAYIRYYFNGWHHFMFSNRYEISDEQETMGVQVTELFSKISRIEEPTSKEVRKYIQVGTQGMLADEYEGIKHILLSDRVQMYIGGLWYDLEIDRGSYTVRQRKMNAYDIDFKARIMDADIGEKLLEPQVILAEITVTTMDKFHSFRYQDSERLNYTVTAVNLFEDIVVTAPARYQLSLDKSTYHNSLTLPIINGGLTQKIYVKMLGGVYGEFPSSISHVSSGENRALTIYGDCRVKYGMLYNWWAAVDQRRIANGDFRVPAIADFADLVTAMGSGAGHKAKFDGTKWWDADVGTNDFRFNARGAGIRNNTDGGFTFLRSASHYWTTYEHAAGSARAARLTSASSNFDNNIVNDKTRGCSIRLCRDATAGELPLPNGMPMAEYTQNDGIKLKTVKIGSLVWLAENLTETRWRYAGYTDWYLPSIIELGLMYTNLKSEGVGDFANAVYWSSSEFSNVNAWVYDFDFGILEGDLPKTDDLNVRPVRDFTSTEVHNLKDFVEGGWVYAIEDLGGSYKYYIAAPEDLAGTYEWGAHGFVSGASGMALGTGKGNTATLVAYLAFLGENGKAAQVCNAIVTDPYISGYDGAGYIAIDDADWILLSEEGALCVYNDTLTNQ
jgi:uncharacterized protein (TIGR02145 family)